MNCNPAGIPCISATAAGGHVFLPLLAFGGQARPMGTKCLRNPNHEVVFKFKEVVAERKRDGRRI